MTDAPAARRIPGLVIAGSGLVVAILLDRLLMTVGLPWLTDPGARTMVGYLVFWVPLVAATVWWARVYREGFRRLIRIRPIDVLWGLVVGLLARALASILEWLVYGTARTSVGAPTIDGSAPNPWMLALATIVAPVLLAPVIEELFFRGVVLSSLRARSEGRATAVIAIAASALIFAVMHLLHVSSAPAVLAVGGSTLLLGLGTATLTVLTGRLGPAVIAHIVFNGAVLLPSLTA